MTTRTTAQPRDSLRPAKLIFEIRRAARSLRAFKVATVSRAINPRSPRRHPGCYGYWNHVTRTGRQYYYNFLPSYTCDESNGWCGYGRKPPGGESCPAITWSMGFRLQIGYYLDALFDPPSRWGEGI